MVRNNAAAEEGDRDREGQHEDNQIQAVFCQAALSHGGNNQVVTRDL